MMNVSFFQQQFLENTLSQWAWALGISVIGFLLSKAASVLLSKQLFRLVQSRSQGIPIANFVALLHKPLQWLFLLAIFYFASQRLVVPKSFAWVPANQFGILMLIERSYQSIVWICLGWATAQFTTFLSTIWQQKYARASFLIDDQLVPLLRDLGIALVWLITVFIMLAKVFDIDVVALMTSLGIGGLAIALAAKETLENFFATFTIFLDKPFVIGDIVQVGSIVGEVEKIGFRSTRIRALDGGLITMPNRLIATQSLEKQTEKKYRRHKFLLKINLETSPDLVKTVSEAIQQLLKKNAKIVDQLTQIRLENLGEIGIEILVMYYVETKAWHEYLEVKEDVNYKILEILAQHKVLLAHPL